MPKWDTWEPEYRHKKNTPTETDYGKMMEKPRPDIDDIGSFNKYIGVTVKLDNETNSGGITDTLKRRATDAKRFAIGRVHNNPPLDTREYEVEL